jgi:hypothetical protein
MPTKKMAVARRKPKARASTATMIKRYEAKLKKLREKAKLIAIKKEVAELQDEVNKGVER